MISYQVASGPELNPVSLYEILRLRQDVFVLEQKCVYADLDGKDLDKDTIHIWGETSGITSNDSTFIVGYLRMYPQQLADGEVVIRIGRVVTSSEYRGKGVASELMGRAVQKAGSAVTRLSAQSHLTGFYEQFGYTVSGPEYDEAGIMHTPMVRPGKQEVGL